MESKEAIARIRDHMMIHKLNEPHAYFINEALELAMKTLSNEEMSNDLCEGCAEYGRWDNEIEYGYTSPCTRCKRRCTDNWKEKSNVE